MGRTTCTPPGTVPSLTTAKEMFFCLRTERTQQFKVVGSAGRGGLDELLPRRERKACAASVSETVRGRAAVRVEVLCCRPLWRSREKERGGMSSLSDGGRGGIDSSDEDYRNSLFPLFFAVEWPTETERKRC